MIKKFFPALAMAFAMVACAGSGASSGDNAVNDSTSDNTDTKQQTMSAKPDKYVEIETSEGDIVVKLYGDTPKHQANFLKLVSEGYYNGTLFHRVIKDFMVQAGDPDSRDAAPGKQLGQGGPGYQIDAEIVYPKHFHKRGALAAARTADQVNPERKSSGSQFYIVTGKKSSEAEVRTIVGQAMMQEEFNRLAQQHMPQIQAMQQSGDYQGLQELQNRLIAQVEAKYPNGQADVPADILKAYTTEGGTPFLDNSYTVFGEVLSGMDVVDKIQTAPTDGNDRPTADIKILSMKVVDAPAK